MGREHQSDNLIHQNLVDALPNLGLRTPVNHRFTGLQLLGVRIPQEH